MTLHLPIESFKNPFLIGAGTEMRTQWVDDLNTAPSGLVVRVKIRVFNVHIQSQLL